MENLVYCPTKKALIKKVCLRNLNGESISYLSNYAAMNYRCSFEIERMSVQCVRLETMLESTLREKIQVTLCSLQNTD